MRDLWILGDGVHGREMADIVARVNAVRPTWNLLGRVAPAEDWDTVPDALVIPDNEWPDTLPIPSGRLATLVDPSVFVASGARIGPGCVVYPHGFVGADAVLGERVFCLAGCAVNHDCVVEARAVLATGVLLAGGVRVGERAYLGQGCTVRQNLVLGAGCLIGTGAVIVRDVAPGAVMVGNPGRALR